jgi:hypothetical protein
MASTEQLNSTTFVPDGISGEVNVFVLWPGIPVTCQQNNKVSLPVQKNIGKVYMPPAVRAAVPDWFNKYVIVFPHTHQASFATIKSEYEKVLSKSNLTLKSLNIGVFSGSGNISIPSTEKVNTLLIMDPFVGANTSTNTSNILKNGGKVFMMFNYSSWGKPDNSFWQPVFSKLSPDDYVEITSSTSEKYGFVKTNTSSGCGQQMWHMQTPENFLKHFRGKIEAAQPPTSNTGTSDQKGAPTASTSTGTASGTGSTAPKAKVDTSSLSTKIKMTKVSGPGEIIGVVEVETVASRVKFEGIQFSEPGEYVVSLNASIPEVSSATFSIKIEPQDEVIPQENKGSTQSVDGNRPIIAQIDPPNIKIPPITFDIQKEDRTESGVSENKEIANSIGFRPLISYNGSIIKEKDIKMMDIYSDGFVPKCTVTFGDSQGLINNPENRPTDDTKFDLFLNSNSKYLKSVHLKLKIENYQQNKRDNSITFNGIMDIPEFYKVNAKSYTGTSFESLRNICKELSLGFNSNINNTEDSMTWKAVNKTYYQLFKDIIEHSYISDDSFLGAYIDFYYSFNYVDVEKEWNRDISTDIGVESQSLSSVNPKDKEKTIALRLTNDGGAASSCMYFSKFEIKNDSTEVSTKKGQFKKTVFYDRIKKTIVEFDVKSLSSKGNDKLILKGAKNDDVDHKTNFRTDFDGFIDSDNLHKNYLYAPTQNKVNFQNLSRVKAELTLPQPNYNLYKYQKVQIDFLNQKQTANDPKKTDERLSGEWIITDIIYSWKQGTLLQKLEVCRKEYSKTKEEILQEKPKEEPADNQKNPQSSTASQATQPKPNEAYEEGKDYTITDEKGYRYLINVKKRAENGNDISATIVPLDGKGPFLISSTSSATQSTGTTSTTASSTGGTGTNTNQQNTNSSNDPTKVEYTVAVENPQTEQGKNITGKITFEKIGPKLVANISVGGFPDNSTFSLKGTPSITNDTDSLAGEVMRNVEQQIINKYQRSLKLIIVGKKNI